VSGVRHFAETDIVQVADLHRRVFPGASVPTPPTHDEYDRYFRSVFLSGPWPDDDHASLVYEDDRGKIVGFLGVLPIRLSAGAESLRASLCSQFCVDPDHRGLVGPTLVREHFEGPQDLSFTDESNIDTLKVWRWAGGEPALLYSLHWTRPLRPARFLATVLGKGLAIDRVGFVTKPLAGLVDGVLTRLPKSPFGRLAPAGSATDLDLETMVERLPELTRASALAPAYDLDSLRWLVARVSARDGEGELRRVQVRNESGRILGWFIYYANRGGVGQVLQIVARPVARGDVLDHLFNDARERGVIALHGRVDPALLQELSDHHCVFSRRGPWTLVHSRNPDLVSAFHRGEAFVSRLDGEWTVRFR
jgi:hypothetical protein